VNLQTKDIWIDKMAVYYKEDGRCRKIRKE
jgi:hypothetical protein